MNIFGMLFLFDFLLIFSNEIKEIKHKEKAT